MIETFTSVNHLNYEQPKSESMTDLDTADLLFYNNLKPELDALSKNPSEETISKILAYSRTK
ncbi:MAG: hypothetical protein EOO92_07935 [Pedobacter sp.]|nr:MAG: hypothetical protein EOO92_07935 [Pedobacter sp.]